MAFIICPYVKKEKEMFAGGKLDNEQAIATFVMCQLKCHAAFAKGGPVPYATQISHPLYGSFTLLFHEN